MWIFKLVERKQDLLRFFLILMSLLSLLNAYSQDLTLDYFIHQGIKNNPVIGDLNGQVRSNQADSSIIKAMNRPKVDFRGYAFYAPVVSHYGYSESLTNIANLNSVVGVSQPVLNKKTIEANLLKNSIQKQALSNTITLTVNGLKKAITSAYIDVWATFSDISLNHELLSFAKEQEKILKSLTENGIYKQTDYLSFMIDLNAQELQLKELTLQLGKQVSDLYILCGIRDTAEFIPVKPEIGKVSTPKQEMLPMFQRFFIDSLRISNENLLIDRNYKPAFNWFSDVGLINNDPTVIYQNFGLSIGLNFTFSIYDGNQRKLNHLKLRNEEDTRAGYAGAFRREYFQQLQEWHYELLQTLSILPAVRSQVKNSEMLVNQEKELINKGSGSVTDYLIAVKNYLSVRRGLIQYEVRILQIQNEIDYWK